MLHPSGMGDRPVDKAPLAGHGSARLPGAEVDSYNLAIQDDDGFVGDRASKRAFVEILDRWREPWRALGDDPLGETPSAEVGKKKLAQLLAEGDPEEAGLVHSAVEEFAQELAAVIRRFLKAKGWKDTESIVIGGGLRASRVGELAVGRTAVQLKADGVALDFHPIRSHPDEAGLLGAVHLMPSWMIEGYGGILAVDIGGTNIRAGVVESNLSARPRSPRSSSGVPGTRSFRYATRLPPTGPSPAAGSRCTASGSSRTSPRRRLTQLVLLSNRRASSPADSPNRSCSSQSSHPCSSALPPSLLRMSCASSSASSSVSSHTTAFTVSW